MGIHLENLGNVLTTTKILEFSSSPKGKQNWVLWLHADSPHWLPRISMATFVRYHFWPKLMARQELRDQARIVGTYLLLLLISSWVLPKFLFCYFLKEPRWLVHQWSGIFLKHWALPQHIDASPAQNKNIDMFHFGTLFTFYIQVELWWNNKVIHKVFKLRVLDWGLGKSDGECVKKAWWTFCWT
jgi:hypothetical protein